MACQAPIERSRGIDWPQQRRRCGKCWTLGFPGLGSREPDQPPARPTEEPPALSIIREGYRPTQRGKPSWKSPAWAVTCTIGGASDRGAYLREANERGVLPARCWRVTRELGELRGLRVHPLRALGKQLLPLQLPRLAMRNTLYAALVDNAENR